VENLEVFMGIVFEIFQKISKKPQSAHNLLTLNAGCLIDVAYKRGNFAGFIEHELLSAIKYTLEKF
jgi:hypothetical protein